MAQNFLIQYIGISNNIRGRSRVWKGEVHFVEKVEDQKNNKKKRGAE